MTTTLDRTAPETTPTAATRAIVVVGIDGSAAADAALLFALHEAQLRSAVLRVVTSHDLAPMTYGYAGVCDLGSMEDAMQAAGRELVATAQETVRVAAASSPVVVETVVGQGRASTVLLEAAQGAALLVVGARGAGAFTRLMNGSTCTEVVHHAHVPVAVVPCPTHGSAHAS